MRTDETIQIFKRLPMTPGTAPPISIYFNALLEKGVLNAMETLELTTIIMNHNRKDLFENWLKNNQLTCTEQLGDLVRQKFNDPHLTLDVYVKGNVKTKVVQHYAENGQFDLLFQYCETNDFQPNWTQLLISAIKVNPASSLAFAKLLIKPPRGQPPLVDINTVAEAYVQCNSPNEADAILLERNSFT